ncbi:transposase family protein [Streptomyces sp. NPDC056549]|uniref:transposase family protein n=1 Tax=Streptomyces sp. NPDC056549 TaxID=3345864 RepID=UPI0036B53C0A
MIVDGTLIPTDRIKADEPYYSQKHRQHSMNVQVIACPAGTPMWFSRASPGRTHDLTPRVPTALTRPASPGKSSSWRTAPTRAPAQPSAPRTTATANNPRTTNSSTATTARLRAPGERAFAQLKSWRRLR